ncbi:hypothetical protein EC973_003320 [Apophysomyces ossiformis]|uniref:Histone acetyltransferase n=1 Tax=Apophysomyces ossiformis TaxID=679940 RepID=A0A8H7BTT9_9FUNG|nr:hypothetical protein EC973_003320 [Apophysomyces ossiformis]
MLSPSSTTNPTSPQKRKKRRLSTGSHDILDLTDKSITTNNPLTPLSDNYRSIKKSTKRMITRRQASSLLTPDENDHTQTTKNPPKPLVRSSRIAARMAAAAEPTEKSPSPEPQNSSNVRLRLTVKSSTSDPPIKRPKRRTKKLSKTGGDTDHEFYETFGKQLTKAESDTKRGTPTNADKERFELAKAKAEEERGDQSDSPSAADTSKQHWTAALEVPKIKKIRFGDHFIDTWYVAPYPEEYSRHPILYICEYCMKYMKSSYVAGRHKIKCPIQHPPGDEIYRDGRVSIFEVDGRKNKIYCQNLCLLAKMFLDHKTLYYDVEPFLFYIMTEVDEKGCHFVGYFSKEKRSAMNYNVSCILTMPIHQRKGYGQYLIDFSYLLSKTESKTGSPERPLSDLGLLSYRSYWKNIIFRELRYQESPISIEELSLRTSMTPDDIISTLQSNQMIRWDDTMKTYVLEINQSIIEAHMQKMEQKQLPSVDPAKLMWTPFVLSRDRLAVLMGQTKTVKNQDEDGDVDVTGEGEKATMSRKMSL